MKHTKQLQTLLCILLNVALCVCLLPALIGIPDGKAQEIGVKQAVRVALCVPQNDSSVLASAASSETGFSIGYTEGRSMVSLFTLSVSSLILIPNRNLQVERNDSLAKAHLSDSGNHLAYSLQIPGVYASYASAKREADRYPGGFVAKTDAGYVARIGGFATQEDALQAANAYSHASVSAPTADGVAVLDGNTYQTLFVYEASKPLALCGNGQNAITLQTSKKAYEYPGFFTVSADGLLRIVNTLPLEEYVKCVMANEIGTNVSVETRRAFSVLIRTVPLNSKHGNHGYDVCCFSCCQAYFGNYRRDSENDRIVESTQGEYVTYRRIPINCLYHASNGGASCSSVAAWGGEEIPYLKSVSLPETVENASTYWQHTFTKQELEEYLRTRPSFSTLTGEIESISINGTDPYGSGYVTSLSATDANNNTVSLSTSEEVRTALKFKSANFTLHYRASAQVVTASGEQEEQTVSGYLDADGVYHAFDSFKQHPIAGTAQTLGADTVTFDGVGVGHGVGFSSTGSEQLVAEGYSYKYLLSFYFDGTEISRIR